MSTLLAFFGVPQETMLLDPERFRAVYVISDLWQTIGWNSIIYLAALSGVDPTLYDAAAVDGAGRFRRVLHVTLPHHLSVSFSVCGICFFQRPESVHQARFYGALGSCGLFTGSIQACVHG